MNMPYTLNRSRRSFSFVAEKESSYTTCSSDTSKNSQPASPNELPRRIEAFDKEGGTPETFFVIGERELQNLLAVVRQCKAQARLVADSLLEEGAEHITEANAAYGLERQMAELQEHVRNLME